MKTRPVRTIGECIEDIKFAANAAHNLQDYWGTLEDVSVLACATHEDAYNQPYTSEAIAVLFWEGCRVGLFQNFPPHKADLYRAFLDQCHTMHLEAYGREVKKSNDITLELWAEYWRIIVDKCGGWQAAKDYMREKFKGLEYEYGEILNESYKKAKQ